MTPKKKKDPAATDPTAVTPPCRHLRIIAEPIKVPDQVAFRCLDCDVILAPDFASPAH